MKKQRITFQRILAMALTAVMAAGSCSAAASAEALEETEFLGEIESETEPVTEEMLPGVDSAGMETEIENNSDSVSVTKEDMPFYFYDIENEYSYPVYFINDVKDLPYINLSDWVDIMCDMFGSEWNKYQLTLETDGDVAMVTRESGYSMLIEFQKETITFEDYDAFIHLKRDSSLLDSVSDTYIDEDGNPILLERIEKGSFDRYGKEIELDLAAYQIPLYWNEEEGLYLLPLQTLSDFLLSNVCGEHFLFNTKAVYCADEYALGVRNESFTPLGESYYYSAPSALMSEELAWYSYCELCLALDYLYGLKDIHNIASFDRFFAEIGYKEDLMSTDPNVKDGALEDFINYYLDDMHSEYLFSSYLTDEVQSIGGTGLSSRRDDETGSMYFQARENADHAIEAYEEVGNTAYITFDHFVMQVNADTYYTGEVDVETDPSSESAETAALMIYAHEQITRENSPIENVVIDLSLNGGGAVDAAAIVCAWFLGEASLITTSAMTGAASTATYRADINLDGVFDEKDTVRDKKLFCLIGPYSFSCGNLVPSVFQSSGRVTLIGRKTGGGSCAVLPITTAYGTLFHISSPKRISYLKNGSYYNTDTGVEPDCVIVKPENFYNREALTEYINQLF